MATDMMTAMAGWHSQRIRTLQAEARAQLNAQRAGPAVDQKTSGTQASHDSEQERLKAVVKVLIHGSNGSVPYSADDFASVQNITLWTMRVLRRVRELHDEDHAKRVQPCRNGMSRRTELQLVKLAVQMQEVLRTAA